MEEMAHIPDREDIAILVTVDERERCTIREVLSEQILFVHAFGVLGAGRPRPHVLAKTRSVMYGVVGVGKGHLESITRNLRKERSQERVQKDLTSNRSQERKCDPRLY